MSKRSRGSSGVWKGIIGDPFARRIYGDALYLAAGVGEIGATRRGPDGFATALAIAAGDLALAQEILRRLARPAPKADWRSARDWIRSNLHGDASGEFVINGSLLDWALVSPDRRALAVLVLAWDYAPSDVASHVEELHACADDDPLPLDEEYARTLASALRAAGTGARWDRATLRMLSKGRTDTWTCLGSLAASAHISTTDPIVRTEAALGVVSAALTYGDGLDGVAALFLLINSDEHSLVTPELILAAAERDPEAPAACLARWLHRHWEGSCRSRALAPSARQG